MEGNVDGLGLGPVEQKYVAILSEGPMRLNVIASMLGLPSRTISQVTEPFLLRAGLLSKDDQGRRRLVINTHAVRKTSLEASENTSKTCPNHA